MPGQPVYHTLEAYNLSKRLVVACYELTNELPPEEKTNLIQYIRTAAVTVHLTIAQGSISRKKKKKKFITTLQNALIVIDVSVGVLIEVGLINEDQSKEIRRLTCTIDQMLDSLKKGK